MPASLQKSLKSLELYSPPLSNLKTFDLFPCQVLCLSPELLEPTEDFILGLHEVDSSLLGEIINECYIVQEVIECIGIQDPFGSTRNTLFEVHLQSHQVLSSSMMDAHNHRLLMHVVFPSFYSKDTKKHSDQIYDNCST